MTGVELALLVLTIVMVAVGGWIWNRTKAWKLVALWVAAVVAGAYYLGLVA